jgi:hypothetical protein
LVCLKLVLGLFVEPFLALSSD